MRRMLIVSLHGYLKKVQVKLLTTPKELLLTTEHFLGLENLLGVLMSLMLMQLIVQILMGTMTI